MNVPEKHRAVAHAWVDGATVEILHRKPDVWQETPWLSWDERNEYRIKPKAKVKKWRWVMKQSNVYWITESYYSKKEDVEHVWATPVQRIDETEIEVDE
jgi:hypothetical protein